MPSRLHEHRTFLAEFRRNFETTGAILPSGRPLARALTRYVGGSHPPRKILEAGPGTGAVTAQLLDSLGPADEVDLVEWNASFVDLLRERFRHDRRFQPLAERCRVIHEKVEALPGEGVYDLIVSGLPLNNFSVELVDAVLKAFVRLLRPGGVLSFFEYVAVRRARRVLGAQQHRERLRGIERTLQTFLAEHGIGRELVWRNVPPAWVHHVRIGGPGGASRD